MLLKLCSIGHSVEGQARSGSGDDIYRRVRKRSSIVQLPTECVGNAAYVKLSGFADSHLDYPSIEDYQALQARGYSTR